MLVTLFGMMIEVREWQPENAISPILFTLLGIVYDPSYEVGRYAKQ